MPTIPQKLKSLFWIAVVVSILVLSWIGLSDYYPETNTLRYLPDRVFRIIKIVTGGDPVSSVEPDDVPLTLIIVKILVSILLIRALFKIVQSVFSEQYTQLKVALKRQHLIVIGADTKAEQILTDYKNQTGNTGVAIEKNSEQNGITTLKKAGHSVILGNANEIATLQNAGALKAQDLICFVDTEQTGIQVANQLIKLYESKGSHNPLRCFVHLDNPSLVKVFGAYRPMADTPANQLTVQFFNLQLMLARRFFNRLPQDLAERLTTPHLQVKFLLFGFNTTAQSLLVQGLRIFHLLPNQSSRWQIVTTNANQHAQQFFDQYPKAQQIFHMDRPQSNITQTQAGIEFIEDTGNYQSLMAEQIRQTQASPSPTCLVALCTGEDDSQNLSIASQILQATPQSDFLVYVLNSDSHNMVRLLTGSAKQQLRFFGDTADFCQYELITQAKQDTLAKAIHTDYLHQLAEQSSGTESVAYQTPWDELTEDAKDANRTQADHIIYKLLLTGKSPTPATPIQFTPAEVEDLAITEHRRWSAHRYMHGWDFGSQRDDSQKLHPSLVDWVDLNETERQKDRDTILRVPMLLQKVPDIRL